MRTELTLEETPVPGLLVLRLPLHEDARGWFKENWQREKMVSLGLPDFGPVQNNMSFNAHRGATRGIHTEPWDKLVSVATGRVFAAWVDMREGPTFGTTFHTEMGPETSAFVPRGVGNSYQALEDHTLYSYLVNDHWRPGARYPALHLGDPALAIPWPIPLDEAEISEKDHGNPSLDEAQPVPPRSTLVLGSGGQLGRALAAGFPGAHTADAGELDLTDEAQVAGWPWQDYGVVLNAAASTGVDAAESPEGRAAAWRVNAHVPATLARLAQQHRFTFIHFSTDYVFDGSRSDHPEDEPFSPLGVYGQSKAAGDLAVATAPQHYLLRTSWLVGDGDNFVRTMARLAAGGVSPAVVDDQVGRLTFTDELVRATRHLLESQAAYGTYNCTNGGPPMSWADVARRVFRHRGRSEADVTPVTTADYGRDKELAPRPARSDLDLARLRATGFEPEDGERALDRYLHALG